VVAASEASTCPYRIAIQRSGFSYGRAPQAPALQAWRGEQVNAPAAQAAFYRRAKLNGAARTGRVPPGAGGDFVIDLARNGPSVADEASAGNLGYRSIDDDLALDPHHVEPLRGPSWP
jgi:hypothetical protein